MQRSQGRDTLEPLNPPVAAKIQKPENPGKSGQNDAQEPFPDPTSAASLTKKTHKIPKNRA